MADDDAAVSRIESTKLYLDISSSQLPIIYSSDYNIAFWGLEKLHPFDSSKWGNIFDLLKEACVVSDDSVVRPLDATRSDLLLVHSRNYLDRLKWSAVVARITEVPPVALLPNCYVNRKVLRPLRYQTGGTVLAGKLAVERGWAINIGGGFHHCSAERGGGFCAYADISLSIHFLFRKVDGVSKVMIVDLDAHQGNGHERDFMGDSRVYIVDVYNRGIYPHDGFAKRNLEIEGLQGTRYKLVSGSIRRKVELLHRTEDEEYLHKVRVHLEGALNEFDPDVLVYNAGTDVLAGDPLGNLSISAKGVITRDEIVFEKARKRKIPIFMVTSGGYQRSTARVVADSIVNLHRKRLIPNSLNETN